MGKTIPSRLQEIYNELVKIVGELNAFQTKDNRTFDHGRGQARLSDAAEGILRASTALPFCPRDTDGDGNCGHRACRYCVVD